MNWMAVLTLAKVWLGRWVMLMERLVETFFTMMTATVHTSRQTASVAPMKRSEWLKM